MKALITGITGQDGSYLAELLLRKNIQVIGLNRRTSSPNMSRLKLIENDIDFMQGDLSDPFSMSKIIKDVKPDYVFNLGAMSHVHSSFNQPHYTNSVTYLGCLNLLEAIRDNHDSCKFYQASSSEMFGDSIDEDGFQRESTRFNPRSPYAIAKLSAHHTVDIYRKSYGIFAVSGILFNHTSPRRGLDFVEKKIIQWAKDYSKHKKYLELGNLAAFRDFGHAKDYVDAMWKITNNSKPKDYVVATGQSNQINEILSFVIKKQPELADKYLISSSLYRPCEVPNLKGDSSLIQKELGWKPTMTFEDILEDIYEHS